MPSLKEVLTNAGVTIPDGIDVAVLAEGSDEIKGLATAKNELNQWKLENKPLLESLQSEKAELLKKAGEEEEARLKLAKENGDYKTQLEIESKRTQELLDGLNASRERTKKSAHEAAIQSVASLFTDAALGKDIAATKVFTELNEAGEPVVQFKMGEQAFTSVDDFKAALSQNASYAAMMPVGGQNKGPSANGQGGQGGEQKPKQKTNEAAEAAAKKGDLQGFLAASLSFENE